MHVAAFLHGFQAMFVLFGGLDYMDAVRGNGHGGHAVNVSYLTRRRSQ